MAEANAEIDSSKVLVAPAPTIALEIYKQKYENFRHFDKLRWGGPAIVFGSGGLFAFARDAQGLPHWWALIAFGFFAVLTAWAMHRINIGVEANRRALFAVAVILGDNSVPAKRTRIGSTTALAYIIGLLGVVAIAVGILRFA